MQPFEFPGSSALKPPEEAPAGQFLAIYIKPEYNEKNEPVVTTAWKPSYEDLQALSRGEPVYITFLGKGFPAFTVYTLDEDGYSNDAGLKDEENT